MAEVFDSIAFEIDFDAGSWTDVSDEVKREPKPTWRRGIMGNGPQDRVARIGTLRFALKNLAGKYSPGHASAQSGFGVGNKVRLSFTFEGETYYKFYGIIPKGGIKPMPGTLGKRYTNIEVHDWMKQISQHELRLMTLALNQRSDQAIALIDANLQISPLITSYATGTATFPRVFHLTRDRTPAVAEEKNIVDSELAYYYVRGDRTGGETVVLEARFTRSTSVNLATLPISGSESGRRLAEDGTYLLDESGDKRIWNETQSASFSNIMTEDMEVGIGTNLANLIKSRSYPVEIDAAATTVLFTLNTVIELAAGETKSDLRSSYIDPDGSGRRVSGVEMVTPRATTDYVANAQEDGGGADKTAQLSVTASYGTEAVEYPALTNSDSSPIFITKLKAVGKGIYDYQPIDSIREDTDSQAIHGVISLQANFKYEPNPLITEGYGDLVLSETTSDDVIVSSVLFHANYNAMTMYGFLVLEPGDRFTLTETQTGIDQDFFLQGYEATIINKNMVDWKVFPRAADLQTFWVLGTSKLGQDTGLGIG